MGVGEIHESGQKPKCWQPIDAEANAVCAGIAKIQTGAGSLPRDCTITDISDGGVKVVTEYLEIPRSSPSSSLPTTRGSVVWCGESVREFSAEFVD